MIGPNPEKLENVQTFDCDPGITGGTVCTEPQYWYYRKAELTVFGEEQGDGYV